MGEFALIAESAFPLEVELTWRLRRRRRRRVGSLLLSNVAALPPVVLL